MTTRLLLPAVLLLSAPFAFTQDATPPPAGVATPAPAHYRGPGPSGKPGGNWSSGSQHGPSGDHRSPHGPMRSSMHGEHGFSHHGMDGGFGMGMEGGGMWWRNPAVATRIGITADQQKKIGDLFTQSRMQLIDLHATLEKEQLLLDPLIDKIADTRASLEKTDAKMLLSIRGVLTPDQWTKLQAEHHGGPGGPMGPGGFHGGPGGRPGPGQPPAPHAPPVE
jgi:Spy/CpxP family protein refolding chaperone